MEAILVFYFMFLWIIFVTSANHICHISESDLPRQQIRFATSANQFCNVSSDIFHIVYFLLEQNFCNFFRSVSAHERKLNYKSLSEWKQFWCSISISVNHICHVSKSYLPHQRVRFATSAKQICHVSKSDLPRQQIRFATSANRICHVSSDVFHIVYFLLVQIFCTFFKSFSVHEHTSASTSL